MDASTEVSSAHSPGRRFGPYRIGRLLGAGAFADVFLARQEILNQQVALKVVRSTSADAGEQEGARVMCRLRHPNIVSVRFADRIDGRLVIAMDLVDGPTLRDVIDREGPLPPDRVARIATALADALHHLHTYSMEEQPLAHLDLKPGNILMENGETPRLTDFGLAFLMKQRTGNSVAGSPSYMAPEQRAGRPCQQSDLWSLGVVTYELLTGTLPSSEDRRAVDLSGVPAAFANVIAGCLEPDLNRRFQSAIQIRDALQAIVNSERACSRCGIQLRAGDAECPECTSVDTLRRPSRVAAPAESLSSGKTPGPAFRTRRGTRIAGPALAVGILGAVAAGVIMYLPIKSGIHLPRAEARADVDAQAAEAWNRVRALEGSTAGSHDDRVTTIEAFLRQYPASAHAAAARARLTSWQSEARLYNEAAAYERTPERRLSEAIRKWRAFLDGQRGGLLMGDARDRLRKLEAELAAYSGHAELRVVGATGLATVQAAFFAHKIPDPYFLLVRDGHFVYRSITAANNPAPSWNERMRVLVHPGVDFAIEIWDRRMIKDDLLVRQSLGVLPPDGPFQVVNGTVQIQLEIRRER